MGVVELLLQKNYQIRVSVRNQKRADQLLSKFPQHKDEIEFAFVDISQPNAFDSLLKDIVGVFHIASPLPNEALKSVRKDYVEPAVQGTLSVLEAALKVPSVKRVVITSSIVAAFGAGGDNPAHVVTEKDWNPITVEYAEANADGHLPYVVSKKLAEKAAWDFIAQHKPHFDITTILPAFIFGPTSQNIEDAADLSSSYRMLYNHISGVQKKSDESHPLVYFVDVRDVAQAHVLAYETPKAANQRYILSAGPFEWQEIPLFAREHFPNQTPNAAGPAAQSIAAFGKIDNSKSINELGLKYHTKEEVFADTIGQIIELNKQGKLSL